MKGLSVVIKGAGEMASGIAYRLYRAGLTSILMTEIEEPLTVRRQVSFSEAVYEGVAEVEGIRAVLLRDINDIARLWREKTIAVFVDPQATCIEGLRPHVVVDAIMNKRKSMTGTDEAPQVIGIGPGFSAPKDVHAVVESNRGHTLGRVIRKGSAEPFTGIPGAMMGFASERVLRSPHAGMVRHVKHIGETVEKKETILYVDDTPVISDIAGILRGLIREVLVKGGEKLGDVDPRSKPEYCTTVSDKALSIGGGVLEAIMADFNGR